MRSAASPSRCHVRILLPILLVGGLLLAMAVPAQSAPSEGTGGQTVTGRSLDRADPSKRSAAAPGAGAARSPAGDYSAWRDLTPVQQQALQPLAAHWDRLSEERKRKWLLISRNYAKLPVSEQAKLHRRMSKWVILSQQQRNQARQNFSRIKQLSPEQKAAEWRAYQALSPEDRRKLADRAPARPAGLAAGKPGATPKLTSVPRRAPAADAHMADVNAPIQPRTLLPRAYRQHVEEAAPEDDEPTE